MVILCAFVSLGKRSLSVGPLCMGHISAWISLAESKHRCTAPVGFGNIMILLQHSAISFTPSGGIISYSSSLFHSFLSGICSAYTTFLGGTWYHFPSSFILNEKVPLKHLMPEKTLVNSMCILAVVFALSTLSTSVSGHETFAISFQIIG